MEKDTDSGRVGVTLGHFGDEVLCHWRGWDGYYQVRRLILGHETTLPPGGGGS